MVDAPARTPPTASVVHDTIETLRQLRRGGATIDELKRHLELIFAGYWVQCPIFEPGLLMYRAVAWDARPTHIQHLTYAPAARIKNYGRVNRAGQSVFYCSVAREAPFFEIGCQPGTKIALSRWRTTSRLVVNSVGYTRGTFSRLASNRSDIPGPAKIVSDMPRLAEEEAIRALIHEFLAEEFTKEVPDGSYEEYKL